MCACYRMAIGFGLIKDKEKTLDVGKIMLLSQSSLPCMLEKIF